MAPTPTAELSNNPSRNNESRHALFLSVTFVLLGVATVFVALRFFCRYFLIKRVGSDDWLILVGLLTEWALAVMNYFHVQYGTGKHINTVTIDGLIPTLRYWFAYQILYPLVLLFIKLSILSFYLPISPQKWYRYTVYGVGLSVIAWTVAFIFAYVFECPNPSTAWSFEFPRGCVNLPALYYSTAAINIASDLIILLLPIPVLKKLQIRRRKKIALIAIFLVGFIAVLSSVARLWALWKYQNTVDVSYDAILILLFSHAEINIAMMCACAPALKPLFKSLSTPFNSKNSGKRSEDASRSSNKPANPKRANTPGLARNRAKFEVLKSEDKHESPVSQVTTISSGTKYYTPPLEPSAAASSSATRHHRSSITDLQLDGSFGGFKRISSNPHFYSNHSRPRKASRLAGEYTVTCSSTTSLNGVQDQEQEYFGLIHRPSAWRRPSSMSRRSYSDSPPSTGGLTVNIEREVKVESGAMTAEEQDVWNRKRLVLDAVDDLW